jgi:hypothetical protein
MQQEIWKFKLEITSYQTILMPIGSKILTVQTQNKTPTLWAICDTEVACEYMEFAILGTGHPFKEDAFYPKKQKYIGTFQTLEGSFVGHLFQICP